MRIILACVHQAESGREHPPQQCILLFPQRRNAVARAALLLLHGARLSDPENEALLARIMAFEPDESGAQLPFTARLAREQGWTHVFAGRVVQEYKRFVALAMLSGHPVTPSEEVDQAWHLHLVYTRSYWHGLCRDVLGRDLHHGPTAGGADENGKFASVMKELDLPEGQVIQPLIGFNLGVEVGQIAVLAGAFAATFLFLKKPSFNIVRKVASGMIGAVGLYWTIERIWG